MTLLLMAVTFTQPVTIPGVSSTGGGLTEFPPKGWAAIEGWSMRVVGDRLEIASPPGVGCPAFYKPEYAANGIDERQAVNVVTVPLGICILRYGGTEADREPSVYPSARDMTVSVPARKPPPTGDVVVMAHPAATGADTGMERLVPATPAPKPPDPPRRPPMPTPAARRPPGARGPNKPTNIVTDLKDDEAEKVTASKAAIGKLETRPAFGGDGDVTEVDLD